MPRFYCPDQLKVGSTIDLPDKVAHHIHVLRLVQGSTITLFNGEGGEYSARLSLPDRKHACAEIVIHHPVEIEVPYALTLAQGLPEGTKMDWIVEKAVELGAFGIQPLTSARSVVRLSGERAEKRHLHWRGIIEAASEQSGRNRLAQLAPISDYQDWIGQQDLHRRILLSPRATLSLSDWARHHPPQALTLIIGPEGGFTDAEEDAALAHGALAFAIGPRILRTETSGLTALAALNAIWGGI